MAAGISTLIDSGIEDIRTGKNIVGAVAAGLVPDVYVPASRQKELLLRKCNSGNKYLTYWEILLMSW